MTQPIPLTVLTEDEEMFRSVIRDFSEGSLRPLVAEMDRAGKMEPSILQGLFDVGMMSIEIPEEHGGAGASFFMAVLGVEELARVDPAMSVVADVQNTLVIIPLMRWGTPEQHARFLPALAGGKVGAFALSEASAGCDAFALRCAAREDGDDFVLSGQKLWITNGDEAEIFIVFATLDASLGYKGVTAFLVEKEMPGFSVGKKEDKLGIRASSTCELILDEVRVPKENVLGEVGKGYKVAIETLNEGRIGIGAQMVGLAQGALEGALAYAGEREQFGKKIGTFQAVGHSLAECATELEAARLMVYNAARLRDAGMPFQRQAAMAKYYGSCVAERVANKSLEVYGGVGFTKDYPAEKFLRDAKIGKIYEGTSFIQLETIAKSLLKDGL